jgi:DNA-directed RNA polymerase subunit RPC12/RpoP
MNGPITGNEHLILSRPKLTYKCIRCGHRFNVHKVKREGQYVVFNCPNCAVTLGRSKVRP